MRAWHRPFLIAQSGAEHELSLSKHGNRGPVWSPRRETWLQRGCRWDQEPALLGWPSLVVGLGEGSKPWRRRRVLEKVAGSGEGGRPWRRWQALEKAAGTGEATGPALLSTSNHPGQWAVWWANPPMRAVSVSLGCYNKILQTG